jgi:hypothetical protein
LPEDRRQNEGDGTTVHFQRTAEDEAARAVVYCKRLDVEMIGR